MWDNRADKAAGTRSPKAPDFKCRKPQLAPEEARRERLRRCYVEVTDFVLADVRPRYDAAGVPCDGETVAAIAATLFIATFRGGGA